MSNFDTYYKVLELTPPVTLDQLKQAYRRLAKTCHPDTLQFQSNERAKANFLQISEAYEILKSQISSPQATPPERTAIRTQKANPTFHYSLGVFYAEIEDYDQAIAEFTLAIRLDPNFVKAYQYRGFLFSKLGFENRADADLSKAREITLSEATKASPTESPSSSSESVSIENSSVQWQKMGVLSTNKVDISCFTLSSASTLLATAGRHRQIHLWELPARQLIKTFNCADATTELCFTPDSQFLYTCHANQEIYRWDLKKGMSHLVTYRKTQHSHRVTALALSPDGKILLSGSEDKTIKLWQLDFGNNIPPMTLQGYGSGIADIAISADNQWFVSSGMEKNVRIRDLHSGKLIRSINNQSGALAVAIAPDGDCLAVGSLDHKIRLWNPQNGEKIGDLVGHIDSLSALQFTHDGKFLISGGLDDSIKVWDIGGMRWLKTFSVDNQPISGIAISSDDHFFVSFSQGNMPILWKR